MSIFFSVFKNKIFLFSFLTITSIFWISSTSYAQGLNAKNAKTQTCATCLNEIEDEDAEKIKCAEGHFTEQECLNNQIRSTEDILRLKSDGLRCNGLDGKGRQCDEFHPFNEICKSLSAFQLSELNKRLNEAVKPSDEKLFNFQVHKLSEGIDDAFTLCCPKDGCGASLDQIEGCNAAKCSNEECQTTFCYLCLKPQKGSSGQSDSEAAHAHVRGHSGNYWEMREGYSDRYHWLIARKKLAYEFARKVDPAAMEAVLKSREALLTDRKMWPFPAGKMTKKWLQEVQSNTNLSSAKRIELLQNEYIFRKQEMDIDSAALINSEIKKLGGVVLASLDVRDGPRASFNLVEANDPRVINLPGFVELGNMYEIPGLGILSGSSPEGMTWDQAVGGNGIPGFCEQRGGRMLTMADWELVASAMGKGTPARYQRNMIPEMANREFWSSESIGNYHAWYFNGHFGVGYGDNRSNNRAVRCVVVVD